MAAPILYEIGEGILSVGNEDAAGQSYIGFEAHGHLPHFAKLTLSRESDARMPGGIPRQAPVFDAQAGLQAIRACLIQGRDPLFADHREYLQRIGFELTRQDGDDVFTRDASGARRTIITITADGHLTSRFEGRFPEDAMTLVQIGCAATNEAWPTALEPIAARVILALDLEISFGDLGYDKGASARRAAKAAAEKAARRQRRKK